MKPTRLVLACLASLFMLLLAMGGDCTIIGEDEPDVDIFRAIVGE